ncbi:hypothetical protein CLU79DRAFT_714736 [Phycomyces nitens]|nr:hypothetical protein CLU79DRAFT_714736 [Phycomyces nitens]
MTCRTSNNKERLESELIKHKTRTTVQDVKKYWYNKDMEYKYDGPKRTHVRTDADYQQYTVKIESKVRNQCIQRMPTEYLIRRQSLMDTNDKIIRRYGRQGIKEIKGIKVDTDDENERNRIRTFAGDMDDRELRRRRLVDTDDENERKRIRTFADDMDDRELRRRRLVDTDDKNERKRIRAFAGDMDDKELRELRRRRLVDTDDKNERKRIRAFAGDMDDKELSGYRRRKRTKTNTNFCRRYGRQGIKVDTDDENERKRIRAFAGDTDDRALRIRLRRTFTNYERTNANMDTDEQQLTTTITHDDENIDPYDEYQTNTIPDVDDKWIQTTKTNGIEYKPYKRYDDETTCKKIREF